MERPAEIGGDGDCRWMHISIESLLDYDPPVGLKSLRSIQLWYHFIHALARSDTGRAWL